MNPQERQQTWEQQHLNDLQGIPSPRYYAAPVDELQRYATLQEQQLWTDQHEQTMQIYEMESWDRIQHYERNNEDLTQLEHLEQEEDVAFRVQQL